MPRKYGITNAAPYASAPAVGAAGDVYFNTTTKILYVSDGAAWLATNQWGIAGGDLIPLDATKGVAVAPTTPANAYTWGSTGVARSRLTQLGAGDFQWRSNASASAADDATLPAWAVRLAPVSDNFSVFRAAVGGGVAFSALSILSAAGDQNFVTSEGSARAVTTFINTTVAGFGGNSAATFSCAAFPVGVLRVGRLYRIRGNGAFQRTTGALVLGVYLQNGGNQLAVASEPTIGAGNFCIDVQIVFDGTAGLTTTGQIAVSNRTNGPAGIAPATIYTVYNTFASYTPMPGNSFTIGGAFATANAGHFMQLAGGSMEIL